MCVIVDGVWITDELLIWVNMWIRMNEWPNLNECNGSMNEPVNGWTSANERVNFGFWMSDRI